MFELFAQDVMKQAFIIGLVISVIAPTIGIFFVVRRFSAIADTLAHISLAGVAISFVTHLASIPTALIVSIVSVLGIEHMREKKTLPAETITSLFLFGGLAVAVVLLGLVEKDDVDVENYLFGNIMTVTREDIVLVSLIGGCAFFLTVGLWRHFFAVSLDEETAQATGFPVRFLNRLLAILGAATIAISMKVVGVLLIGALMVIPVLSAMQFRRGFQTTWIIALIISVFSVLLGLALSYYLNLASGGTIVIVTIICFLLATFFSAFFQSHAKLHP
ncbi:MAG: metal ABC transporter permease [Patescibacteria group bacterium]